MEKSFVWQQEKDLKDTFLVIHLREERILVGLKICD
jgi:hypothetical protein